MAEPAIVARELALAFLAGEWRANSLCERGEHVLGGRSEWLAPLVRKVVVACRRAPALPVLCRFIAQSDIFQAAYYAWPRPRIARSLATEPQMGASRWPVPQLATSADLAAWLEISIAELDWFADPKQLNAWTASAALHHYACAWLPKRRGGYRLLEAPKARLKAFQRRILREILNCVPVHDAAHGFVRGRSVLSLARAHAAQSVVLRIDLEQFFWSIGGARIRHVFLSLGYPDAVARLLTGLVTTVTPSSVLGSMPKPSFVELRDPPVLEERGRARRRLAARHLAQGAPSSPVLANLCAFGLDTRLAGAARVVDAHYGRYADDLTFSGGPDFARRAQRFEALVGAIALEEGFLVNHRKTRLMRSGAQQRLLGLVLNAEPAVPRDERKLLEAILHNATRFGLESQNRTQHPCFLEHLRGRVAWVKQANPGHARKLSALLALLGPTEVADSRHFEVLGGSLGAQNPALHPGTAAQCPPILAQLAVSA